MGRRYNDLLNTEKAKQIKGAHFSAQHQVDSKGRQEGQEIGDLSGQHDPAYTLINETSESKDFELNNCIRMTTPTALRVASGSDGQLLNLCRLKSVPT